MVFYRLNMISYSRRDVRNPLDFPSVNGHTLVTGASGSGKSYFVSRLFPDPAGVILFKPDGVYSGVPLGSEGLPLPFAPDFSPSAVASAYLYALHLDFSGIMASSLVPALVSALVGCQDFKAFKANLGRVREGTVLKGIAGLILSHFNALYPERPVGRPKKKESRVFSGFGMDFSGMDSFSSEFGAEMFLRSVYSKLDKDFGTLLIDEFHHVARAGSVVDTLLREFRIAGNLVGVTQALADVSPSMLANFGYILVGRSVHPWDIEYLGRLDSRLPKLVKALPARVFLSLTEYLKDYDPLPVYGWFDA
jgi:hypothetical protein